MKDARPLAAYSDYGLEFMASRVPGWGPGSRLNRKDRDMTTAGLPDRVMVTLLEQIPHPTCRYIKSVFDCENISRWYASQVAELWGRLIANGHVEPMCLAMGVVCGKIPVGDQPAGNHAAVFFFNDKNEYRIWEPQQRYLLRPDEVALTESTWELEFH